MPKIKKFKKKPMKKKSAPALNAADIQNVRVLADQLGKMIALSGFYESSFNLKTLAKELKLSNFIPSKAPNKKEAFTIFLRRILQERPRMLKKLIREAMPRAIEKRHSQGDPILEQEALDIAAQLEKVGVKMRKELLELNLPKERPRVVPPPKAVTDMLKKFKLHPALTPECETLFIQGHMNESVRKALEKFEKQVQQISGLTTQGFDLMMKAFDEASPVIKLNALADTWQKDEQAGFRFMAAGAMRGWRNNTSHGDAPQVPHYEAFGRLAFVSNSFHTLDARLP